MTSVQPRIVWDGRILSRDERMFLLGMLMAFMNNHAPDMQEPVVDEAAAKLVLDSGIYPKDALVLAVPLIRELNLLTPEEYETLGAEL